MKPVSAIVIGLGPHVMLLSARQMKTILWLVTEMENALVLENVPATKDIAVPFVRSKVGSCNCEY